MKNNSNPQRLRNFWEPVYDPTIGPFKEWKPDKDQIAHSKGVQSLIIDLKYIKESGLRHLTNFIFENIDFCGLLDGGLRKFTFKNCTFLKCSFRDSDFQNVKFNSCEFQLTTFALGRFENCEFRYCKFNQIGVSGNALWLKNCYINPELFLDSLYLNTDESILRENNTDKQHQKFRQAKTKSVLARKLIEMNPIKSDIDLHILSIKTARKLEVLAYMKESIYFLQKRNFTFLSFFKHLFNAIFSLLEYPVIMSFGWLSGWGYKIGKTLFIGFVSILILTIVNKYIIFLGDSTSISLLKTLEYWFLFGYTKYNLSEIPSEFAWLLFLNSSLGMIWFAALIPIVINKLGKSNE